MTFSTQADQWRHDRPSDVLAWWNTKEIESSVETLALTRRADNQEWKSHIQCAARVRCKEAIWGKFSEETVYLIKRVSEEDLLPWSRW